MRNVYAIVTGASSGLGFEFAKQLSNMGYKIVLVARRRGKLEQIQKILKTESIVFEADLGKTEECIRLMEETKKLDIEVLVNNAGFGDCGRFYETDANKDLAMIDVNVSAGLFPAGPYMATYYATKAYVTSLTRAVARELEEEQSEIYVGALCPGPVDTEFNDVADVEFALKGISAKKCVSYAIDQMFKKRVIIIPTLRMKVVCYGSKLIPSRQVVAMTGRQQKRKKKI